MPSISASAAERLLVVGTASPGNIVAAMSRRRLASTKWFEAVPSASRKASAISPGSFGSRLFEDGERLVAMFGEVLLALDGTVPPASMDGEGGVSQGGEGLGGVAGSGAAGVLAAGPIADVVQAVLDSPMPSRDVEQGGGVGALARQAGDGVHDLDAVLTAQAASSLDAADLAQTRPLAEIGGEALAALQASDLDAAVPLLDRLDPSHVRRGRPLRRGGNPAGRPGRCRLPASAGCSSP